MGLDLIRGGVVGVEVEGMVRVVGDDLEHSYSLSVTKIKGC